MMFAIQGDRATAAVLAATCRIAYSWVVPVLYSIVVLESSKRLVAFEASVRRSKNNFEGQRGSCLLAKPLGAYVRHLWLGPTRVEHTCTVEASSLGVEPPCVHCILSLCPSLLSAVVQQCANDLSLVRVVGCLPQTLESLCIFPCASFAMHADRMNAGLNIPNIHHLTSLRDVTIVRRMLSPALMERLEKMPSLRGGITQMIKFPKRVSPPNVTAAVEKHSFIYSLEETRNAVRRHHSGVLSPLRRNLLFAVDRPQADLKELPLKLMQAISPGIDTSSPGWTWPSHITVRCMSDRVEGKELGLLYNDWVAQRNSLPPLCRSSSLNSACGSSHLLVSDTC